jgi:hypothetical protein
MFHIPHMSQEFLELQFRDETLQTTELGNVKFSKKELTSVICLKNIFARWDNFESRDVLQSVTLTVEEATLFVIVGPVCCGKVRNN